MKFYDVSMAVHPQMPVWKNRDVKRPIFTIQRDFNPDGSGARETRVAFDMHTGTHIDAPLHFIADGDAIEQIPLSQLVRMVKVFDLTAVDQQITKADLVSLAIEPDDLCYSKLKTHMLMVLILSLFFLTVQAPSIWWKSRLLVLELMLLG